MEMSGTSMAAPHVAGVAALLLAQNPTWSTQHLIDAIITTVRTVPSLAGRVSSGGIVDAYAALQYEVVIIVAPTQPQDFTAVPGPGSTQVTLTWSAPESDGGSAITNYEVSMNNGASWITASSNTGHIFSGLTNGITYTFLVRAVNSVGAGSSASLTATSYDAIELLVKRLYLDVLVRDYDAAGLAFWSNLLRNGSRTGVSVARDFFFSEEFINRQIVDEDFINRLYVALMDRTPDPGGRNFWLNQLNMGLPRENIFARFVNSEEFDRHCREAGIIRGTYNPPTTGMSRVFITRMYRTTLQREPDTGGLNFWTRALENGSRTGAQISFEFIFSSEMLERNLSNVEFVDILYVAMMGRSADTIGRNFWVNQLQNGVSRYSVFVSFVMSSEFDRICKEHGILRGVAPPQRT